MGDYVYVTGQDGLHIINTSKPNAPTETQLYNTSGGSLGDVIAVGEYVYVDSANVGVLVLDVSTPESPVEVGSYFPEYPQGTTGMTVVGQYAYVAYFDMNRWGGVVILHLLHPATPVAVDFYEMSYGARSVAVTGGYAYVGAGEGGLYILEIPK